MGLCAKLEMTDFIQPSRTESITLIDRLDSLLKRIIDLSVAALALFFLSPSFLVIAWLIQRAFPLHAIFFLEQGDEDRISPIGPGEAVCRIVPLARDTTTYLMCGLPLGEIAAFNLQRFENLVIVVKTLPAYKLNVKLHGKFWLKKDEVLFS